MYKRQLKNSVHAEPKTLSSIRTKTLYQFNSTEKSISEEIYKKRTKNGDEESSANTTQENDEQLTNATYVQRRIQALIDNVSTLET